MCIHVRTWLSIFNEVTVLCDYNLLPLCLVRQLYLVFVFVISCGRQELYVASLLWIV